MWYFLTFRGRSPIFQIAPLRPTFGNKHIGDIIVFLYKNKEHNKTKHVVIMTPFNFDANEIQYRLT